jgi:2-oxoglutarate dehydrogenase complex dehydrogenase (E1) component-like enzyme
MVPCTFITSRLHLSVPLRYAGRPPSPSPATGNAAVHKQELADLLDQAYRTSSPGRERVAAGGFNV